MSSDWFGILLFIYGVAGAAFLVYVSLDRTVMRKWHKLVCLSLFLPVTVIAITAILFGIVANSIVEWLNKPC